MLLRPDEQVAVHGASSIGHRNVGACAASSMRAREPNLHARQLPAIGSFHREREREGGEDVTRIPRNEYKEHKGSLEMEGVMRTLHLCAREKKRRGLK